MRRERRFPSFRSSKSSFVLEGAPPKGLRRLMLSA